MVLREFAEFLDLAEGVELDALTLEVLLAMVKDMSRSYKNSKGTGRGGEKTRAQSFRDHLLKLMQGLLDKEAVSTIEPSLVDLVSEECITMN